MVTKVSDTVVRTHFEEQFQHNVEDSSGLNFVVRAGTFVDNATGTVTTVPETTVVLPSADTTIIWVDLLTKTIASALSGSEDITDTHRLFSVVTVASAITSITDQRQRREL